MEITSQRNVNVDTDDSLQLSYLISYSRSQPSAMIYNQESSFFIACNTIHCENMYAFNPDKFELLELPSNL